MLATVLGLGPLAFYPGNFALNFSAAHMDIVRVPHHELMNHDLIDSWSLEAWIYPHKEQKRPAAGTIVNIVGFPGRHPMLGMTYDGFAVAQLKDTSGKWYTYQGTTPLLKDGQWHHLAATWNGRSEHPADNKLSLYVDGQLEVAGGDLDDGTGEPKTPNTHGYTMASVCTPGLCEEGMQIGGLYQQNMGGGYTGRFFSGTIDEVRVWTRELGKSEIVGRMHKPLQAQDEQQLLFHFPFDDAGMDMASSEGSIVVFSKALDWPGMLGTSRGTNRPHWSVSNAPLTCTANSRAPACLLQSAASASSSSAWSKSGERFSRAPLPSPFCTPALLHVYTFTPVLLSPSAPLHPLYPCTPTGYSLFTLIAAMLATMTLTSTLAAVITHAVLTGRLELPRRGTFEKAHQSWQRRSWPPP